MKTSIKSKQGSQMYSPRNTHNKFKKLNERSIFKIECFIYFVFVLIITFWVAMGYLLYLLVTSGISINDIGYGIGEFIKSIKEGVTQ